MSGTLQRLAEALRAEGGLLGEAVREPPAAADDALGAAVAVGPRTHRRREDYALLVEAIREGYLAHYAEPRVLASNDPDLALLAGDRLYALGLARLAELGDLQAVVALADVISDCAQAQAEQHPTAATEAWQAGVTRVAGTPSQSVSEPEA